MLIGIIPSQNYQAESATRGSFFFSLTIFNENAYLKFGGNVKIFLVQEIGNSFVVLIP